MKNLTFSLIQTSHFPQIPKMLSTVFYILSKKVSDIIPTNLLSPFMFQVGLLLQLILPHLFPLALTI